MILGPAFYVCYVYRNYPSSLDNDYMYSSKIHGPNFSRHLRGTTEGNQFSRIYKPLLFLSQLLMDDCKDTLIRESELAG